MSEDFKSWLPVLIFFIFLALIAIGIKAEAQMPDPDTPFLPYMQYVVEVEDREDITCEEKVEVEVQTQLHGFCNEPIPTQYLPDGQALWQALPPGCIMVLVVFPEDTDQKLFEVHQNEDCWIFFRNMKPIYEKPLQGA